MYDEPIDQVTRAIAVVSCELCDDDGYRGTVVCDHIDRTNTHKQGMAKVRRALMKTKLKRIDGEAS